MTHLTDACAAVTSALEGLSAAMATGRPEAVLAAEEPLALAARQLQSCLSTPGIDRARASVAVRDVRMALQVCQALGRAAASLVELTAGTQQPYTASGRLAPSAGRATVASRT
jgi:hypothetical protein